MLRTVPKDSTLYQALEYIYTKGMAILITRDERHVPANIEQFVSVMTGGNGPADVGGIGVTDAGFGEITRMIRTQYAHARALGCALSMEDFRRKYIESAYPPGSPAIRVLVTLKNQELATEQLYEQLLEPQQQDIVQ